MMAVALTMPTMKAAFGLSAKVNQNTANSAIQQAMNVPYTLGGTSA
jgi:hypothetical protein